MSRFSVASKPTGKDYTLIAGLLRISVLSSRIIRVEKDAERQFLDRPTQMVLNRNFAKPEFKVSEKENKIRIVTKCAEFIIDKDTADVECVLNGKRIVPNAASNLGGTARTLDGTFGAVRMNKGDKPKKDMFFAANIRKGIMSRDGVAVIDDSKSFVLEEDGSVSRRRKGISDKYVFAFGDDYLGGLKEYYALTGYTPLLPKYALGNWWSRYYAYSDAEYLDLMDKFRQKNVPLTVAAVDMDWHIVKNVPKDKFAKGSNPLQGAGWTGYTFERSLFPDYKKFLKSLKERGLAVTMNLHPRDGVRYYEQQYEEMARLNGIDPASKKPVEFDLTDKKFLYSYFDVLHHPYERDGVDFWWIDWQQGTKSKAEGLDPLWLLNHYHTMDIRRKGGTGIILSRYAGYGSHRYPLGFSGDTFVCWKSLKFQPYFTALASNVGYSWWSHDIGGHLFGKRNEELYLRWLQFGVFSPINRLHSSNNAVSKEPWLYGGVEDIAEEFMRLRHRLLPYLYTANVLTAREGVPLIQPLYYRNKCREAYLKEYRNEYYFGSEMLVSPVVSKMKKDGAARVKIWLPEGSWTDFFTGEKLEGGREYTLQRDMNSIPVLIRKGAIIPLIAERKGNSTQFDDLEVRVYSGDGAYTLYDEEGSIEFRMTEDKSFVQLSIKPSEDCKTEHLSVCFVDASGKLSVDGKDFGEGNRVSLEDLSACTVRLEK